LEAGKQRATGRMHDGVGEGSTKLSPSLQVLGHGFVLATVPKQQTASVGKGHKKFSSPLLKPSGSYKKNPTGWLRWLVAPPPCSVFLPFLESMVALQVSLPQAMVYPALRTGAEAAQPMQTLLCYEEATLASISLHFSLSEPDGSL